MHPPAGANKFSSSAHFGPEAGTPLSQPIQVMVAPATPPDILLTQNGLQHENINDWIATVWDVFALSSGLHHAGSVLSVLSTTFPALHHHNRPVATDLSLHRLKCLLLDGNWPPKGKQNKFSIKTFNIWIDYIFPLNYDSSALPAAQIPEGGLFAGHTCIHLSMPQFIG